MRNFLLFVVMLLMIPHGIKADNTATCFLGIPIDGFKKEFVKKIKAKGFKHHQSGNYFTGYYYDYPVYLFVESHDRIVNRVTVYDIPQRSEEDIRKRFNALCKLFDKSSRYVNLQESNPQIPDDVNILREMRLHGKMYKAIYHQVRTNKTDSLEMAARIPDVASVDSIDTQYPIEDLKERRRRVHVKALKFVSSIYDGPHTNVVWFAISEKFGQFAIVMVYENLKNYTR